MLEKIKREKPVKVRKHVSSACLSAEDDTLNVTVNNQCAIDVKNQTNHANMLQVIEADPGRKVCQQKETCYRK